MTVVMVVTVVTVVKVVIPVKVVTLVKKKKNMMKNMSIVFLCFFFKDIFVIIFLYSIDSTDIGEHTDTSDQKIIINKKNTMHHSIMHFILAS